MTTQPAPFSWADVVLYVKEAKSLRHFTKKPHRTAIVQARYDRQKKEIVSKYASYEDFVRIRLFQDSFIMGPDKKVRAQSASSQEFIFEKNKYPYHLERGIHHYVLFARTAWSSARVHTLLPTVLPPDSKEYVVVRSRPEDQSVPGIWHVHVFVRAT